MNKEQLLKKIDPIHLENLEDSGHFSVFSVENDYQILILRGFSISGFQLTFQSKRFVIDEEVGIYEFVNNDLVFCEKGLSGIIDILEPIYDKNEKIIEEFISEIDKLEDSLFDRATSRIFVDNWFDIKKDLALIERYYSRNITVLKSFQKFFLEHKDFPQAGFRDLINDAGYVLHNIGTQTARLDALYDYHVSLKNEKLNNNLYTLTVLSAVFLPLNLIVGFFGMNTENLFFKENPLGTKYVLSILVGSFLISFLGIPLVRLIDKYFLRFILGKSHFYKKISRKIDKIEGILKME